jgi:hypothetical protein
MSLTLIFGVALASVVAVAGCTGGSNAAEPSSSEPTSTTAPPTSLDIPPVAQPLDVSTFAADPCALLDESQRQELGLPAASKEDDTGSSTGDLHADPESKDPSNYLRLVIFADGGLADQYAQCGTLDCSQWTTDTIGGYPVIRATDELTSKYGSCKLLLGVADDATVAVVDVRIDTSADGPDCDRAERAAKMVLATLK